VDAEITRTRFEDNVGGTGGSGTGGAIDFRPGDDLATATRSLAITDSSFLRNVAGAGGAGQGGAINWSPDSGPSHLTIDGSTFAGNRAGADDSESYSYGGAINFARGALTVRNSTFSANRAEFGDDFHSGGAISLGSVTDAQLTHVTMVGNSVGQGPGGGISVQPYFTSTAAGAAVVSPVPSGDLTVTNSIVAGNTSDAPNGPIVASGVRAQAAPVPADCSRPVTSGGGNIEGDTTCGFTGTGDHQTTDPKVAPLAANGGLTTTHAIGKDSPAFDAALGSACLPKDQRGVTRPQFAACDIGAFELAAPPPPTPAPVPAGAVQGQTQRSCVSRRAFRIRIRVPKGAKVVRAMVLVNGKPVAVRRGTRLTAPVRLRGLPKGRFRVKIVLFLKDGRRISGTRRYHTCHEAIPPKRVPKV
jgi:hypothetical protein